MAEQIVRELVDGEWVTRAEQAGGGSQPPAKTQTLYFFIPGVAQDMGQEISMIIGANVAGTVKIRESALTISRRDADDWISVYKFSSNQPIGTQSPMTAVEFDTGDDPAPRGTALTWDEGAPTIVSVGATGIYDISGKIVVDRVDPAVPGVIGLAEVLLNGDNTGPGYTHDLFEINV